MKQNSLPEESATTEDYPGTIAAIPDFLNLFMSLTLAKRILSMALIDAGLEDRQVAAVVGSCTRTVHDLRKKMGVENISDLLIVRGGGRKSKIDMHGCEEALVEEIHNGDYHTRQEIADMIWARFQFHLSPSGAGKFLKKAGIDLHPQSFPGDQNLTAPRRVRILPETSARPGY